MTEAPAAAVEVLLIEDDPVVVRTAREAFGEPGRVCRLSAAPHGVVAMAFLRRERSFAHAPRPDVVLFDVNLSNELEQDALRELRRHPVLNGIPVVALVTAASDEEILKSHDRLGVRYCVTKPSDRDGFRALASWIDEVALGR